MKTHLKLADANARSETLLVFLPGASLKPEEFEREGFIGYFFFGSGIGGFGGT